MDSKHTGEALEGQTAERLGVQPAEIARRGWHVMIPGDVFNACYELIEKLLRDGSPDAAGRQFLEILQTSLVTSAKPYAAKNKIQPATSMPTNRLPGLP